jgi:M6 family metalloprotease-like protein
MFSTYFASKTETPLITVSSGVARVHLLIVPVAFADTNMIMASNQIHALFFSNQYSSVSNYYAVQSFGKFAFSGTVCPTITMSGSRASYTTAVEESSNYATFIKEAASKMVNFFSDLSTDQLTSTFDRNGDGFVDIVVFYHAGEGAETSGNSADIHSHQYSYYLQADSLLGSRAVYQLQNKLYLGRYLIVPEIQNGNYVGSDPYVRSTIGTVAHELGHTLGLVDLYNTSGTSSDTAVGNAEIMSLGSYNFLPIAREAYTNASRIYPLYGKYPAPFSAYNKSLLGWLKPTDLSGIRVTNLNMEIYSLPSFPNTNRAYRLVGAKTNQYWLIENRNYGSEGTNFDQGIPGQGMLIWRVNEEVIGPRDSHYFSDNGINNVTNLRGLRLEPSNPALYNSPDQNPSYLVQNGGFWTNQLNGFSPSGNPAAIYEPDGLPAGINLSRIGPLSSAMTFDFSGVNFDEASKVVGTHFPNPYQIGQGLLTISVTLPSDYSTNQQVGLYLVTEQGLLVRDFGKNLQKRTVEKKTQYLVQWDGSDDAGKKVNTGLYYYRVKTDKGYLTAGRVFVRP